MDEGSPQGDELFPKTDERFPRKDEPFPKMDELLPEKGNGSPEKPDDGSGPPRGSQARLYDPEKFIYILKPEILPFLPTAARFSPFPAPYFL